MIFRDQSHINQVRDALWGRPGRGATVMVGSGFSRNAHIKVRPDASVPPLWKGIATEMYERLYPSFHSGNASNIRPEAVLDYPKIAQEYEAAFGRGALHDFLKLQIRDDEFRPGRFHARLLALPWRDLFTTNWDTLLERSGTRSDAHNYSYVLHKEQIPYADPPRIVKLHGSLPAYFPLIVTEEDYRTYPVKFSPFVNTIQQAMMETVFCLIGFSGDDPNFLHWSGWVRDNLGSHTPKIYLAGWLELSSHRRRMLENLGVVPIDLSFHPKATCWPKDQQHKYATDWILHSLERGESYDSMYWPDRVQRKWADVPKNLEPIEHRTFLLPLKEDYSESKVKVREDPAYAIESVPKTIRVWMHNRNLYPGWLVFPTGQQRQIFELHTDSWEPLILQSADSLDPKCRLNAFRELVWRRELLLEPISSELAREADSSLEPIDCERREIEGESEEQADWPTLRESWRSVALALVTKARFDLDQVLFEERIRKLLPFADDEPDVKHRIQHERCLWALFSMDLVRLDSLVSEWNVEVCDPAWRLRKGAILWEMGRADEADSQIRDALESVRTNSAYSTSLAGKSRESWGMLSLLNGKNSLELRNRWDELASHKCDAFMEREFISDKLVGSREREEAPPFEPGQIQGQTFSSSRGYSLINAYRAVRLAEIAGLPPVTLHREVLTPATSVASHLLEKAAEQFMPVHPEFALRLLLRSLTGPTSKALKRILSRPRVANLPYDTVFSMAKVCRDLIDHDLPKAEASKGSYLYYLWDARLGTALEMLSRLVQFVPIGMAESVFKDCLKWYKNKHFQQVVSLHEPLKNVLQRSWGAMPPSLRRVRAIDLLRAPIAGVEEFAPNIAFTFPEPSEVIYAEDAPNARIHSNEDPWPEICNQLVQGLNGGTESRKRALHRLARITVDGPLNESENNLLANAIWSEEHTDSKGIPEGLSERNWWLLLLPEPIEGLAEERFWEFWLTESRDNVEDKLRLNESLFSIGMAMVLLRKFQRQWRNLDKHQGRLITLIRKWAQTGFAHHPHPFFQDRLYHATINCVEGLHYILREVEMPKDVTNELFLKARNLSEQDIPSFQLADGLVKILTDEHDEIKAWLRTGLVSDNKGMAAHATIALIDWLSAASESKTVPPPEEFIREVGVMIFSRKKASLPQALEVAKWVFDQGTEAQQTLLGSSTVQGLGKLAEELKYDRDIEKVDGWDIPYLRMLCIKLAQSIKRSTYDGGSIVTHWLEIAEEDPLPEARFLVDLAK